MMWGADKEKFVLHVKKGKKWNFIENRNNKILPSLTFIIIYSFRENSNNITCLNIVYGWWLILYCWKKDCAHKALLRSAKDRGGCDWIRLCIWVLYSSYIHTHALYRNYISFENWKKDSSITQNVTTYGFSWEKIVFFNLQKWGEKFIRNEGILEYYLFIN
jgi:hypothetical protein